MTRRDFLRVWRKGRTLGAMSALSLVIGTAATAVVLTALWRAFIAPIDYPDGDRLVVVQSVGSDGAPGLYMTDSESVALRQYSDLFEQSTSIEHWPVSSRGWRTYQHGETVKRVSGAYVHVDTLVMLGARLVAGRHFSDDDRTAEGRHILVDEGFAREVFGDAPALGRHLMLDGRRHTIVGLVSRSFVPPIPAIVNDRTGNTRISIWSLQDTDQLAGKAGRSFAYTYVARLASAVPAPVAQHAVTTRLKAVIERPPDRYRVVPIRDAVLGERQVALWAMLALAVLLLSVSVVNAVIASVIRGNEQARDRAIEVALGGHGLRLWRTVAIEWLLLAGIASLAGWLVVQVSYAAIGRVIEGFVLSSHARPSAGARVLIAALPAVLAVTASLCATLIRRRAGDHVATQTLRSESARPPLGRTRAVVSALQVALVTVTTAPALALVVTVADTSIRNALFERDDILLVNLWLVDRSDDAPARSVSRLAFVERVKALAGVESVALALDPPLIRENGPRAMVAVAGRGERRIGARSNAVDHQYFMLLGLAPIHGRIFDGVRAEPEGAVAVLSEALALRLFGTSNAVDRLIDWRGQRRVIGIVPDLPTLGGTSPGIVYVPWIDSSAAQFQLLVKVANVAAASTIAGQIRRADPGQPVDSIMSLDEVFDRALGDRRVLRDVALAFGGAALVLGLLGLIVVTRYWTQASRDDIWIRVALGASPAKVAKAFARRQAWAVLPGVCAAVPCGIGALRVIADAVAPLAIDPGALVVTAGTATTLAIGWAGFEARRAAATATAQPRVASTLTRRLSLRGGL